MSTDIVNKVKPYTDNVRTRYHGKDVRHSVADSIDAIAAVVGDAVNNQIADYDAFMIERRYPINDKEFYSIIRGGISDYGYPSTTDPSNKNGVTNAIGITKPVLIKIEDNTGDNYYQINRVWGYTDAAGQTPEATAINIEHPLGRDGTLLILPVSGRVSFRVSFRRLDNTVAVDTEELSQKFRVYTAMDSDVIYDGRDKLKNTPTVLANFNGVSNLTRLNDMPKWSSATIKGDKLKELVGESFPGINDLLDATYYVAQKEQFEALGSHWNRYTITSFAMNKLWGGYTIVGDDDSDITWVYSSDIINNAIYGERDRNKNDPKILTWFRVTYSKSSDDQSSLDSLQNMPPWSITTLPGRKFKPLLGNNFPGASEIIDDNSYLMRKEQYGTPGYYFYRYIFTNLSMSKTWIGVSLMGHDDTITWTKVIQPTDKTLSIENAPADAAAVGAALESNSSRVRILVFGNSFSYSDLGLVPALLNECGVLVEFGILYKSGATIQDHIERWNNDQSYEAFSYCDGTRWTNNWINDTDTMTDKSNTARNILKRIKWDYIVFQSGDPTGLETLADSVTDFISNDRTILENFGSYPVSYLFNCNHSKGANCKYRPNDPTSEVLGEPVSNQRLLDYASRAEKLLEDGNFILDILPCGTAVQNARQLNVFKGIGDVVNGAGHLCHDDVGHLQNGIATLIPAYAATLKILEVIGSKQKIYGSQIRPTDTWLEQYNLLTRGRESTDPFYGVSHGLSKGLTRENVLLAAKCAVQAYKHPYQITDITGNSPAITNPPSEEFSKMVRDACVYRVHVVLNNNIATMQEAFDDIVTAHHAGKMIEIEVNIGIAKVYGILNAESIQDQTGVINGLIFSVVLDLATAGGGTEAAPQLMQIVIQSGSVTASQLNLETA